MYTVSGPNVDKVCPSENTARTFAENCCKNSPADFYIRANGDKAIARYWRTDNGGSDSVTL